MQDYDIKYIDPTYLVRASLSYCDATAMTQCIQVSLKSVPCLQVRALPTNANDRILCQVLGQASVHGAFAGYTGFTTGKLESFCCP